MKLRPIVDGNGLIRAKTNVAYRDDTNDYKFPIILPYDHTVVKLLIMNEHIDLLLADVNKKRTFWDLARVEKLIPGRDAQIRLVVIITANSEFLRPVQRLFRLDMDSPALSVLLMT
ncbi:hypothetical protein TNCV_3686021 [Trichonephila clavipes]|nr:hypothetical protein TNCV_3686021 [Trichonephila clavipes]